MSPHFVVPYRKSSKNDGNEADATGAAVGRPAMRLASPKRTAQQDVQALQRIRCQLIKWRTALANPGAAEYGESLPEGWRRCATSCRFCSRTKKINQAAASPRGWARWPNGSSFGIDASATTTSH